MSKGEAIEAIATGALVGIVAGLGGSALGLLIAHMVMR